MNLKNHKHSIEVFSLSVFAYLVHKLIFFLNENNPSFQNLYFSLETIYGFFLFCSLFIIMAIVKVKSKSIDNVGFTFIWATLIKMGFSFVVLTFIINSGNPNVKFEKINFFIIFAIFLTIETIVTIRSLKKNQ